ncbi:MAG: hypothetical protein ABR498_00520 [Candidatus Dormibacteria bacterium]
MAKRTTLPDPRTASASPAERWLGLTSSACSRSPWNITGWSTCALTRIVRSLLENAVRHSPDGGSITVAVRGCADAGEVSVPDLPFSQLSLDTA